MENKKKDELQNRREFFKKAAKGALPILGAIVLANVPDVLSAAEEPATCIGSCYGTCKGTCTKSCANNCTGMCKYGCFATSK